MDEDRKQIEAAEAKGEEETPAETSEKEPVVDETEPRATLPEHVVIAPDDPGPEGSGFEENSAKGESAKW